MSDPFRDDGHEDDPDLLDRIGFGAEEGARRSRRGRRPTQQTRFLRVATLILALALVGVAGFFTAKLVWPVVGALAASSGSDEGGDYEGAGEGEEILVVIPKNASGTEIGKILEEKEVVKSGTTFSKLASLDDRGSRLQPGTYRVKRKMSSDAALGALINTRNRAGSKITIPEGKWKDEVYAMLSKATKLPLSDFTKITPQQAGLPPEAKGNFEGWLFPATYEVDPSFTALDYVKQMVTMTKRELDVAGAKGNGQAVLTKASIVQAEGSNPNDFAKIARVIDNRLDINMELRMDSSVHFLYKKRGTATTTDDERANPSPYNTYIHKGLPPGPISNPGGEAIQAVMNPAQGSWLFFVAVDPCTGETKFADNFTEHHQNELKFHEWQRRTGGKCK